MLFFNFPMRKDETSLTLLDSRLSRSIVIYDSSSLMPINCCRANNFILTLLELAKSFFISTIAKIISNKQKFVQDENRQFLSNFNVRWWWAWLSQLANISKQVYSRRPIKKKMKKSSESITRDIFRLTRLTCIPWSYKLIKSRIK